MDFSYSGKKQEIGNCEVYVKVQDSKVKLKHIIKHSLDGFQWGYMGSGPADLALSIITDFCERSHFGDKDFPKRVYQDFKKDFLIDMGEELNITSEDISEWLKLLPSISQL